MYLKVSLFMASGLIAALLIFVENPNFKVFLMLAVVIWSFCRAYYFAFYVIEKYVDPAFKFSSLLSALKYVLRR